MATLEAITMNISSRERKEKIQRYFNNEFINIYVIVAFNVLNIFNFLKKKLAFLFLISITFSHVFTRLFS